MAMTVTGSRLTRGLSWASLALSFSSACNCAEPQRAIQQAGSSGTSTVPVSVNELMVAWVDPSSHQLWDRERDGQAPKNESEWQEVERHGVQLAAAGTVIALGGTGRQDSGWAKSPDWKKFSLQLSQAGMAARDAARQRSFEALVTANGELVEVCESCHKAFKPDAPTEGITHQSR